MRRENSSMEETHFIKKVFSRIFRNRWLGTCTVYGDQTQQSPTIIIQIFTLP
jgi:hypothetical protein